MKHNVKISLILISMFLITQIIGLGVIHSYREKTLPYGLEPPKEISPEISLINIIFAFVLAIFLLLLLMKIEAKIILKIWFFIVVITALGITFNSIFPQNIFYSLLSLVIAIPLAFYKVFKRNLLIHNLTELLVYPGIAAVFVPLLNVQAAVILLILISVYDIYAVWHSGIMQKMAKFQMENLKIFSGFFVPYLTKKQKVEIKKLKKRKEIKNKNIKINLAVLGGGDVVFPIILAGTILIRLGFLYSMIISLGAAFGLTFLLFKSKKGKFYPAMPFITAGCFVGLLISYILYLF